EEVAQKAREVLPMESEGRILKAVQLVLAGDVTLLENGSKARVASQSNGTTDYFVVNGTCQCRDFTNAKGNAPENFFCKHRLAYGIYKRAYALAKQRLDAQEKDTSVGYALKAGQLTYDCRYSTMHGMPVTGGRGFRVLKPLW